MTVLFQRSGNHIEEGEHFFGNFGDGLVCISGLVHLDEIAVLCPSCTVHHERNVILMCNLGNFSHILHGNCLAADRIIGNGCVDEGHVLNTDCLNQLQQLFNVHIAFERIDLILAALRNLEQNLFMEEIARDVAHLLNVTLCGIKVGIGRDGKDLTGPSFGKKRF